MSTVFDLDGVKHWVSHTVRDDQPDDLVKVVAHTHCRLVRNFQRGNVLLEDDAPTCLVCIAKHDLFRKAEQVAMGAGGNTLEWLRWMQYGENGVPAP